MRYIVQHAYRSRRDGRDFGPWEEGESVELDNELDAEWVNRDSPGTLEPEADDETAGEPDEDQAHAEPVDQNDPGEKEAEENQADDDPAERQQRAPRNRQRRNGPNRKA